MRAYAVITICLTLVGCAGNARDRVSAEELYASIRLGTAPTIVDVRTASEYDAGHVPGAVRVPFYSAWRDSPSLPSSKTELIVVYCAHGPRAGVAKFGLWVAGYEDVRYLDGHMAGWKRRDLPLERITP
jgi:rhodanese-related sulfurtransferase